MRTWTVFLLGGALVAAGCGTSVIQSPQASASEDGNPGLASHGDAALPLTRLPGAPQRRGQRPAAAAALLDTLQHGIRCSLSSPGELGPELTSLRVREGA